MVWRRASGHQGEAGPASSVRLVQPVAGRPPRRTGFKTPLNDKSGPMHCVDRPFPRSMKRPSGVTFRRTWTN